MSVMGKFVIYLVMVAYTNVFFVERSCITELVPTCNSNETDTDAILITNVGHAQKYGQIRSIE